MLVELLVCRWASTSEVSVISVAGMRALLCDVCVDPDRRRSGASAEETEWVSQWVGTCEATRLRGRRWCRSAVSDLGRRGGI